VSTGACAGCTGNCCRDVVVRVTGFDAWRIRRGQRLEYEQFVEVRADEDPLGESFRIGDQSCSLFLTKSAVDPASCVFLMNLPGDMRRCGIYADRPTVCAVYPMTLRYGSVELREDVRCAPSDWNLAQLDYPYWRGAFLEYAVERRLFGRVVETWNRRAPFEDEGPARERFFRYLDDATEALVRARDRLGAEATEAALGTALEAICGMLLGEDSR
jgi:Fe-S-cluster containining protein